jgi:hypothetical protein
VTAAYVPGSAAVLGPAVMPRGCLHAATGDEACVLIVHHVRERKTGPRGPVTVLQCRTHRRAFTHYPLGHMVIAGQSPLRSLLARDDQEAMARRIAHYAQLRLLSREAPGSRAWAAGTTRWDFKRGCA